MAERNITFLSVYTDRKRDTDMYKYIYQRKFIIGIDSHGYGGQKVPQSAICRESGKLVIQNKSKGLGQVVG